MTDRFFTDKYISTFQYINIDMFGGDLMNRPLHSIKKNLKCNHLINEQPNWDNYDVIWKWFEKQQPHQQYKQHHQQRKSEETTGTY